MPFKCVSTTHKHHFLEWRLNSSFNANSNMHITHAKETVWSAQWSTMKVYENLSNYMYILTTKLIDFRIFFFEQFL